MEKNNISVNQQEFLEAFFQDSPEDIIERVMSFSKLMMKYNSAIREIETKLNILNDELSLHSSRSPIETIKSRVKKPISIAEKLRRKGFGREISEEVIIENVNDVAGIRVICPFIDDIYQVVEMLIKQDDITLVESKDYIKNPKPNGYRSYHMIVEIPVFFSEYRQKMKVEIQIRTVVMDFWASLEHKIQYKNLNEGNRFIVEDLKKCADTIAKTDEEMQRLRKCIYEESMDV